MQAVILAAGEGKRMLPLTIGTPKPMLLVAGKPILERIIDALPPEVTEIIIVVGYKAEVIENYFGDEYKGKKITYVTQDEPKGTYHALLCAKSGAENAKEHSKTKEKTEQKLSEKFLLVGGDDLHAPEAFAEAITFPLALLASRHDDPTKFGVVSRNPDGTLRGIVEKPESFEDTLVSTGAMVLDGRIFEYEVKPAANGELYLPVALEQLAAEYPVQVVEQSFWVPLGYPEDIAEAEERLREIS